MPSGGPWPAIQGTAAVAAVLVTQTYAPRIWRAVRVSAILHAAPLRKLIARRKEEGDKAAEVLGNVLDATSPLEALAPAVLAFEAASLTIKVLLPAEYRALRFWRMMMPVFTRYVHTKQSTRKLTQAKRDAVWAQRHEWGGQKVYELVLTMSGFYVKSAQILGSKADFMPEQWTKRLRPLFDDHPPERRFHVLAKAVERHLSNTPAGKRLISSTKLGKESTLREAFFKTFDETALAAASIGQVHRATLLDGTPVVVKVQKLGVDMLIKADLANMKTVARFLRPYLPFDITPIADESVKQIPKEFDFEREARMQMDIRTSLNKSEYGEPHVHIPKAHLDLSTTRLLVMEYVDAVPFSKLLKRDEVAGNARLVSLREKVPAAFRKLLLAYGHMMFEDGKFHADPHAGNLMMREDGSVVLIDFGQTKVLDDENKLMLAQLVDLLAHGDKDEICNMMDEALQTAKKGGGAADSDTVIKIAYSLFDTRYIEEAQMNPFGDDSLVSDTDITFNSQLWMIVRLILLLRGMFHDFGIDDISAVEVWRPFANRAIDKLTETKEVAGVEEEKAESGPAPAPAIAEADSTTASGGARILRTPTMAEKTRLIKLARWLGAQMVPNDRSTMADLWHAGVKDKATLKRMVTEKEPLTSQWSAAHVATLIEAFKREDVPPAAPAAAALPAFSPGPGEPLPVSPPRRAPPSLLRRLFSCGGVAP